MNLLGFVVCGGFGVKVDSTTFRIELSDWPLLFDP